MSQNVEDSKGEQTRRRKTRYGHAMVLNNGSVIRVRREVSTSDEETSDDDVVAVKEEEPEIQPDPEPEEVKLSEQSKKKFQSGRGPAHLY